MATGENHRQKSDQPLVPESILRKRHDLDELARKKAALSQGTKKKQLRIVKGGTKKAIYVKKPETIISQARSRRNHAIRFNRVMKKGMQKRASKYAEFSIKEVEEDGDDGTTTTTKMKCQSNSVGASMVFVVRVRDSVGMPREIQRVLNKFRLQKIHQGVFLRYDETNRRILHSVEPWVVYGPPTKAMITDLIERRGHITTGMKGKQKPAPMSDNTVIEEALGNDNILCIEDVVYELHTVGKNFDKVAEFIWPFTLADHKTEFERKTLKLKDGKHYGDQGDAINEYIQQVL